LITLLKREAKSCCQPHIPFLLWTDVYADGEVTKIGECPPATLTVEKEPSKSFLTTDISY